MCSDQHVKYCMPPVGFLTRSLLLDYSLYITDYIHLYTYIICMCICIYTYIYTQTYTHIYIHIHIHVHIYIYTYIQYIHIYTYIHKYINTYKTGFLSKIRVANYSIPLMCPNWQLFSQALSSLMKTNLNMMQYTIT